MFMIFLDQKTLMHNDRNLMEEKDQIQFKIKVL